jgi:hypothetical protein
MFGKTGRRAALAAAVAVVGAMSVAAAPASAKTFHYKQSLENWVVRGSLTPKKLNEQVTLPEGSSFNGSTEFEYVNFYEHINGSLTGTVAVPPFNASLKILGLVPTTVGVTFTQVGKPNGTIKSTPVCENRSGEQVSSGFGLEGCVVLDVPTQANLGITFVNTLGLNIPTHCETVEPVKFNLHTTLTLGAMIFFGPHFAGTTGIPPMACDGLEGLVLGVTLTAVMSGPDNPYAISLSLQ